MNASTLYEFAGIALFCMGLFAVVVVSPIMRKILALNVAGSGVFLFLVALAHRSRMSFPDPVPHAMVLTGIVVAVSATALALLLACRIQDYSVRASTEEDDRVSSDE